MKSVPKGFTRPNENKVRAIPATGRPTPSQRPNKGGTRFDIRPDHKPRSYLDRPHIISHRPHHDYVYRDWHDRISYRIIWPQYRTVVYYSHGPWRTYRCVHPYYLRKYAFVSIGGYWPIHYNYLRYYWYGYHPYAWEGYYPIAREIAGNNYNYYTYNYYGDTSQPTQQFAGASSDVTPVDHTTFADVRARMALQQAQEPSKATVTDIYFEEAVKAFEKADYALAIENFAQALVNAPDDMVLPFAYAQALFATGQYSAAA